jgi:hypothetical protein
LVDALDLKSNWYLNASAGSSPARGTSSYLVTGRSFFYDQLFDFYSPGEKLDRSECDEPVPNELYPCPLTS